MRTLAEKPVRVAGYKQQAKRLREYLAQAGIDLKHTNALEAVAKMHGFANYHLLEHAATTSDETWLVSVYCEGILPLNYHASALPDGIALFCHQLARIATQESVELRVRAKTDGTARGLYAVNYGALVCSLTSPPTPSVRADVGNDFAGLAFEQIATSLDDALYERDGWQRFSEKVHDEGFIDRLESRPELAALQGALSWDESLSADPMTVQATRYLLGVAVPSLEVSP